jgi:hypothetical protein
MTEPVTSVSGAQGTSAGGSYSGGNRQDGHKKKGPVPPQGDLIEISEDARSRSEGNKSKGIIEYLKELLG